MSSEKFRENGNAVVARQLYNHEYRNSLCKEIQFSRTDEIFEVWDFLNKSGFPRLPFI